MIPVSLLLLAFLCAREMDATELNDTILTKIIKDFRRVRPQGKEQFSFLLALKPSQCRQGDKNMYLNGNISSEQPQISGNSDVFKPKLNYIALHPDLDEDCSEFKIIFNIREAKCMPLWFADQVKKARILTNGGCVILYTENTPCTRKCFNGKNFIDIVGPLKDLPFMDWNAPKVHKYFVYGEVDNCDKNKKARIIQRFQCLDEGGIDPNGTFVFRRCKENLPCDQCNRQNDYCVNN
ncbi:uncharacterized protein LOC119958444 [Scyliorhinus canicula]|uniref:uncharacterized protein LOC119958444 n=1 Tax=Scyliorhinus canicula TaxID=7830 RepID=UPI0018F76801|nr:uncharacterized protein LOC119958444 [Scyliorhinus canicula]XP_038642914.1 uncharacterized protein LOC119958444 [Scyliorhinus canicula]XP_038642915.1 uncharacterized protein LOC119958444 [Scyliorhinus canicula]